MTKYVDYAGMWELDWDLKMYAYIIYIYIICIYNYYYYCYYYYSCYYMLLLLLYYYIIKLYYTHPMHSIAFSSPTDPIVPPPGGCDHVYYGEVLSSSR